MKQIAEYFAKFSKFHSFLKQHHQLKKHAAKKGSSHEQEIRGEEEGKGYRGELLARSKVGHEISRNRLI